MGPTCCPVALPIPWEGKYRAVRLSLTLSIPEIFPNQMTDMSPLGWNRVSHTHYCTCNIHSVHCSDCTCSVL